MRGITIISENNEYVEIEAGAAEDWDQFVGQCVDLGYAGLENLSLIPGSIGASPIQNIGAYGTEVKDTIIKVKAVDIRSGEPCEFTNKECAFGYRDSIFKRTRAYIVTSVVFRLSKSFTYKEKYIDLSRELEGIATPTLTQVRNAIIRIRTRKLPDVKLLPNAGSFFKNPVLTLEEKESLQKILAEAPIYSMGDNKFKTSAAFLIEKAGFKGKRSGMVGTYADHALIIVNYGTEKGQEIVDFMHEIQQEVNNSSASCSNRKCGFIKQKIMSSFIIEGGHSLRGNITPQGAKNEALQVICATLLTREEVIIDNVPDILDVNNLIDLIRDMGSL